MIRSLKNLLRSLAYTSGLLRLLHRIRNRRTLTVFMFHRVLPVDSPAYACADKEFTFTTEGFGQTLDFILRHYNVVSHAHIQANISRNIPLPDRAGLITFDDGWRDTLIHAAPELRERNLPAVLFLATEVLDLTSPHWWQDRLVDALSISGNRERLESSLGIDISARTDTERIRQLTARLASLPDMQRHQLLDQIVPSRSLDRQMLNSDEVMTLLPNIAVAGHGHTHAPLTHCVDAVSDLTTSHAILKSIGCDAGAMSFPHGAYEAETDKKARLAGFEVIYTSDACLVDTSAPIQPTMPLGRIHVPENEWTCRNGRISLPRLATFLFFRPTMQ